MSALETGEETYVDLLDGLTTPRARGSERPVLLLHGFGSSPRAMVPLELHLRRTLGRPILRLPISRGLDDLRNSALAVAFAIEEIASDPAFGAADVVGHSMGGLVATYLLKRIDRGRRVRRVITLGTPHHGTPAARAGAMLTGGMSRALKQMQPGSELIRELSALETPTGSELISISAGRDLLVPAGSALLRKAEGQTNLHLPFANHRNLLVSNTALAVVGEALSDQRRAGVRSAYAHAA